jgi:hypothetical protein
MEFILVHAWGIAAGCVILYVTLEFLFCPHPPPRYCLPLPSSFVERKLIRRSLTWLAECDGFFCSIKCAYFIIHLSVLTLTGKVVG